MSSNVWDEIAERVGEHGYMAGLERSDQRVDETAEVFTPTELVISMLKRLSADAFAPGKSVLDPACGDGQFLVAVKWAKVLIHGMSEESALADIYGIDIMRDNVDLCRERLGGGTIVMGDALNPAAELASQTEAERLLMRQLFDLSPEPERLFA